MNRNLTCIICPRGCALTVAGEGDALVVTGNACPKGKTYATLECTHPVRTVTSIVRVSNRIDTMVSVKTVLPIPKEHIFDAMARIRQAFVEAPIESGAVILSDVFGTEVVATKTVL